MGQAKDTKVHQALESSKLDKPCTVTIGALVSSYWPLRATQIKKENLSKDIKLHFA